MRLSPSAFLLSLAAVAACSADRVDAPHSQPQIPRVSASEIVLGGLTVFRSEASGINDGGTVVGNAQLTVFDREQAAVWMPPDYHLTFLPDAGVGSSSASRISNDGTIAGTICDGAHLAPPCHPVYWRNGVLHQLGGLGVLQDICPCDGYTLVGHIDVNGNEHGAIWEDEILIEMLECPRIRLTRSWLRSLITTSWGTHSPDTETSQRFIRTVGLPQRGGLQWGTRIPSCWM